jgi:hypothetical protein
MRIPAKLRVSFCAVVVGLALCASVFATRPAMANVNCASLAGLVEHVAGFALNKNPIAPPGLTLPPGQTLSAATPVSAGIVPAAAAIAPLGASLAYCQVTFQLEPAITIEVGLPLNAADGGTGGAAGGCGVATVTNNECLTGNWNGKIEAIGNGGYAGDVPAVTSATNVGFVGSSTDNGHSTNWCNATNPRTGQLNAQPGCGFGGGGFVLPLNNQLNTQQVNDFIDNSEVAQTIAAVALARAYYGIPPRRTYWNGCSTGGRQGMQMAQFHPELFDGILAGSPAFNWNRFIPGSIWFPAVLADVDPADCPGGTAASCTNTALTSNPFFSGVNPNFTNAYTAANNAAVAACAGPDGAIDEPRLCTFNATTLVGKTVGPFPPSTSASSVVTEAQAKAINLIWDGPRNQRGQRLWGGVTRGTSFGIQLAYGIVLNASFPLYWVDQNPSLDIVGGGPQTITTTNFSSFFQLADRKFADTIPPPPQFVVPAATDSINLDPLIWRGTKLLHYRGLADPLIVPFGSWNYDTRLFERYGVLGTRQFYRSFYYPGNGHCGGNSGLLTGGNYPNAGLINASDLFNDLIAWVENGNAPDEVVAYTLPNDTGNSTLICAAPNQRVYRGGPITSAASYSCTNYGQEPLDLAAYDQTAPQYYEVP